MQEKFSLKLTQIKVLTPKVRHLVFALPEHLSFHYQAGQFLSLHLDNAEGQSVRRNYSIANTPSTPNTHLEIACSYVPGGLASEFLFQLREGDSVTASGPYGIFVLKAAVPARYILIATGTGITPYRSMLPALQTLMQTGVAVVVVFGARTRQDALYAEEFLALAAQDARFCYLVSYSQEPQTLELAVHERLGRVQAVLAELQPSNSDLIYLCGNPNMVDETFAMLQKLAIDRSKIQREKYISGK
jgi:ferredoxin-NADP reductase